MEGFKVASYKSPLRGVPLDLILMVREQVTSGKFDKKRGQLVNAK